MIQIEKKIPDLLTFGNLFCGFLAILACLAGDLVMAGWLVFLAAFFDLSDGLAARLLKTSSAFGMQLDSLCDIVSFGLAPAIIAYMLLVKTHASWLNWEYIYEIPVFGLVAFLYLAAAASRLARFNIDPGQKSYFRGLPTPAAAMFLAALPLMLQYDIFVIKFDIFYISEIVLNPYFIVVSIIGLSWLMISKIRLFSFKISWQEARNRNLVVLFLVLSLLLFVFLFWIAVPLIIILYILFSFIVKPSSNEIQSAD